MRLRTHKAIVMRDGCDVWPAGWLVAGAAVIAVGWTGLIVAVCVSAIRYLWTH